MNNNSKKRKQYLIDKAMQYQLALHLSLLPLFGVALGWINLNLLSSVFELQQRLMGVVEPTTPISGIVYSLLQIALSFGVIVLISIIYSHRIAGPVTAMRCGLQSIAEGNLSIEIGLRSKDYLKRLAKDINIVVRSFKGRVKTIDQAVNIIEQENIDNPVVAAQLEILKKELAYFQLERLPTDTNVGRISVCNRVTDYFQKR